MITAALQVTVFVADQDEALAYYTERMGFVVRSDEELWDDFRYLTVAPNEDAETVLELVEADTPAQEALIGGQAANRPLVMFASDDIERDYQRMTERGVEFDGEPTSVPGGVGVAFEDCYGNQFDLFQPDTNTTTPP
ncbi:glyoxalase (plasmid) [Salinigranum rubrum]|uniref:Glyoxalase n=1 Tax=Salinigranum rubrum TaxID=755307 RepID=A0A2I8VQA8_9EURY|nr:VOC family protein [Salinigranum rubrum]AUV84095.1 glyoxalase [Salinigranum rubrum]